MDITINGVDADIRPETEKTVGEVLCALESWLADSGFRLSGLSVDGEMVGVESMEECFTRDIATIGTLDIKTSSIAELLAEAFCQLAHDLDAFEAAGFDERRSFASSWLLSPQAILIAEQCPDFFEMAANTFSGEGAGAQALRQLAGERLRELEDPAGEIARIGLLVAEVCGRLEEFPLDTQTGKDARAAETINLFSGVAEKVFRLYYLLKMEGFPVGDIVVGETPIDGYISEFSAALRDMLTAYEQRDTVLAGDIAEYEMAPRLRGLHNAVNNAIIGD
ncbi:MAG: hypothetical protein FWG46_02265 [Treponema sp.]|nr:hypothetical protein [Treponema sp.]